MSESLERDLTTLEYAILGLLSTAPQSGYSILGSLSTMSHRWTASPSSVYPTLKRMEQQRLIVGEIEAVRELRPRKVYRLTPDGELLLDAWLKKPVMFGVSFQDRDLALCKFLFAEQRLSRQEVLAWLDAYEAATEMHSATTRIFHDLAMKISTLHQKLILEATTMELELQGAWIRMARQRVAEAARAEEGEESAASPEANEAKLELSLAESEA